MAPSTTTTNATTTGSGESAGRTQKKPVFSISGMMSSPLSKDSSADTRVAMTGPTSPTLSTFSSDGPLCRICHDTKDASGKKKLISPCGCDGSAKFIHKQCLQTWTKFKGSSTCEICHQSYQQKYVKFKLTSSEENTVASAITILLLLVGVLAVGVYLLVEYLIKLSRDPSVRGSNEIWVSTCLVIIGVIGMGIFLPWFVCFCSRTGRTPRTMVRGSDTESSSPSTASETDSEAQSVESSLSDLSGGYLESARIADNDSESNIAATEYHSISETNSDSSTTTSQQTIPDSTMISPETKDANTYIHRDVEISCTLDETPDYISDPTQVTFV